MEILMSTIKRKTKTTAATTTKTSRSAKTASPAKEMQTIKIAKGKQAAPVAQTIKTNKVTKTSKSSKMVIKEHQTRVEILQLIADKTNLKRVEVESVFTHMADIVKGHMAKNGSGEVMIPKLGLKIRKVRRKATNKRKMVSPLTGNEVIIPAKPARDDVKLIALKTLKTAVV